MCHTNAILSGDYYVNYIALQGPGTYFCDYASIILGISKACVVNLLRLEIRAGFVPFKYYSQKKNNRYISYLFIIVLLLGTSVATITLEMWSRPRLKTADCTFHLQFGEETPKPHCP